MDAPPAPETPPAALPGDDPERVARAQFAARLEWLEGQRVQLSQSLGRVPVLLATAVAAIPAGIFWGPYAVLATLAIAVSLPLVTGYFIWAHQQEYATEAEALRRQLASPPATPAQRAVRASIPWRTPGKPSHL
jgi:hypothetical protein